MEQQLKIFKIIHLALIAGLILAYYFLGDLGNLTDAGTCCKSCQNSQSDIGVEKMELYLEEILNKFNKE